MSPIRSSPCAALLAFVPLAASVPTADWTSVDCDSEQSVPIPDGTVATGQASTPTAAKEDLAAELGIVCNILCVVGCEMSFPGNWPNEGTGGTKIFGGHPGNYLISVSFGTGGSATVSCSACG